MNEQTKAIYFCMECQKPYCSDCILNYKLKYKKSPNENEIVCDLDKDNLKDSINENFKKKSIISLILYLKLIY